MGNRSSTQSELDAQASLPDTSNGSRFSPPRASVVVGTTLCAHCKDADRKIPPSPTSANAAVEKLAMFREKSYQIHDQDVPSQEAELAFVAEILAETGFPEKVVPVICAYVCRHASTLEDLIFLSYLGKGALSDVCLVRLRKTPPLSKAATLSKASPTHSRHIHDDDSVPDFTRYESHSSTSSYLSSSLYALKCISKAKLVEAGQQYHVFGEKAIHYSLDTTWSPRLVSTFQDKNALYMMLEVVWGEELFQIMDRHGTLPEDWARFYAACVIETISYLHSRNIVNRDIKPEDLVVGCNGYVKLVDYSFARRLSPGHKTFTLCGSPSYMAPEMVISSGHTRAVDWWGLGVLIYEMLVGTTPFVVKQSDTEMPSGTVSTNSSSRFSSSSCSSPSLSLSPSPSHRSMHSTSSLDGLHIRARDEGSGLGTSLDGQANNNSNHTREKSIDAQDDNKHANAIATVSNPHSVDFMETYQNILDVKYSFPKIGPGSHISRASKDLIRSLLQKDPFRRLGMHSSEEEAADSQDDLKVDTDFLEKGLRDIKQHVWFKDFDWCAFEAGVMVPPFLPHVKNVFRCTSCGQEEVSISDPGFALSDPPEQYQSFVSSLLPKSSSSSPSLLSSSSSSTQSTTASNHPSDQNPAIQSFQDICQSIPSFELDDIDDDVFEGF